jgi:transcriptional regulator of acetoin/glycerol metabolism
MTIKGQPTPDIIPLKQTKKAAVLAAVRHFHGNIPLAAEKLEIPVRTLYRKLKQYGVDTKGRPRQDRNP